MKRITLIFALLLMVTSSLQAQKKEPDWVVRINGGAFLSIANVSIEKTFLQRHSISLIPSYVYLRSNQATYRTYGAGTEYRYYFTKKNIAPESFYGGLGFSLDKGKAIIETNNNEETDVTGYTTHLVGGKQWILKKGWAIDAKLGAQYIRLKYKNVRANGDLTLFEPAIGAGVGYSF